MSQYLFGLGSGWLPKKADKVARKHGARLVNFTDPGCKCGYGCRDNCPSAKRHWFEGPNRGEPYDKQLANAVMESLIAEGILNSRRKLVQV